MSHSSVPEVLYGLTSLVAGVSIFFLPETNGYPMPANKADLKRMYERLPPMTEEEGTALNKVRCFRGVSGSSK